ncbi:MAG: NADH-quinone oxidoreductase subunit NuoE [bacterium]
MLITEDEALNSELTAMAESYGRSRSALIPMLQNVQSKHSRISEYAMQLIADILDIHPVEVYGVVSFYHFLNTDPKGRFIIRLCRSISCEMTGKDRVARQLINDLGIDFGQTTADGRFTLEWANCIGMCDQGPALMINDAVYTNVTPDKLHDVLDECRRTMGLHAMERRDVCPL